MSDRGAPEKGRKKGKEARGRHSQDAPRAPRARPRGQTEKTDYCPACQWQGFAKAETCTACGGTGRETPWYDQKAKPWRLATFGTESEEAQRHRLETWRQTGDAAHAYLRTIETGSRKETGEACRRFQGLLAQAQAAEKAYWQSLTAKEKT